MSVIAIGERNFLVLILNNDSHFVNFVVSRSKYTRQDLFSGLYLLPDIYNLYIQYLHAGNAVIPNCILQHFSVVQDSLLESV